MGSSIGCRCVLDGGCHRLWLRLCHRFGNMVSGSCIVMVITFNDLNVVAREKTPFATDVDT
jgi:hypothetical protein